MGSKAAPELDVELEEGELRGPCGGWVAPDRPLGAYVLDRLAVHGDRLLQEHVGSGTRWTATTLARRARGYAAALQGLSLAPGDAVALLAGMPAELGPLMLGTILAGAALQPINPGFDQGDLRRLMGRSRPRLVLEEEGCAAAPALGAALAELQPPPRRMQLAELRQLAERHERQLARGPGPQQPPQPPQLSLDLHTAPALLMCSSGTTGLPKVVNCTHYNVYAALQVIKCENSILCEEDRILITSPCFWLTGVYFSLCSMDLGFNLVNHYGCSEAEFLDCIEKYKPNSLLTASNFMTAAAKVQEEQPRRLGTLRQALLGGAALGPDSEQQIAHALGCKVLQAYGMTEANGCCMGVERSRPPHPGSVGRVAPFVRCRVVDPANEQVLGLGKEGELRFKGPVFTPGYLSDPAATAGIRDAAGWLRSGDLGHSDKDGFFYVTGRIKDIIKYRGVHVSPIELEEVLQGHPAVLEAAVVGVPHPTLQELPRAYVALRSGASVSEQELISLVQNSLADHKHLRGGIVFMDTLPKTPSGKISRAAIRSLDIASSPSTVSI